MGLILSCLLVWSVGGNDRRTSFPPGDWVKGRVLVGGVKLGMTPDVANRIFGPPDARASDAHGPLGFEYDWPVFCYYFRFGVVVEFRSSQFRSSGRCIEPERVHGGIE